MHGDAVGRMTDNREQRAANRAAVVFELDDVADDLSVLAALKRWRFRALQPLRSCRAHEDRVVPGEPGNRLRQLLQPPVVGKTAVENTRIETETDLEP